MIFQRILNTKILRSSFAAVCQISKVWSSELVTIPWWSFLQINDILDHVLNNINTIIKQRFISPPYYFLNFKNNIDTKSK